MASVTREIRHALRRLRRAPAFAVTATLTLALGIGATTAVFTVVNAVLLRPLPYDHPDELVALSHTLQLSGVSTVQQSDASFILYRRASRSFSGVGAYTDAAANLDGGSSGLEAERLSAGLISADVLRLLRIAPLHGRIFLDDDDRRGAAPVVLLGQRLWQRRFGGDAGVIGRRIMVDGISREVIGVLRGDFRFPSTNTELWLPLALDPAKVEPASFNYSAIGRLAPNVSRIAATEELTRIMPRVVTEFPGQLTMSMLEQVHLRPVVTPLRDVVVGDIGRVLTVGVTLFAAVMFSVLPMLRIGSMQLIGALKDLGRSATAGRDRHRARMALVVSQVALALLLLVGSGLMARSFARLRAVNPGFDPTRVLTFRIAVPQTVYKADADVYRLYESVLAELAALAGVKSVGGTSWLPLYDSGHDNGAIWVEDHPTPAGSVPNVHDQIFADQRYLATMHIPLLAGRGFTSIDPSRPPHEALVSRSFAERYWKGGSAIGKRIHPGVA